jgi:cell division septation protein DedD
MPRNEDGEYELILGNRQLLSIFFIVVVLLGSGFTLGYMLGRNSGPVAARNETAATAEHLPPLSAEPPPPFLQQAAKRAEQPAAGDTSRQPSTPATQAQETKASSPAESAAPPPKPAAAPANDPPGDFRTGDPPPGSSFIQATFTNQADAESTARTVGAQLSLPMWVAPHESYKGQFRVLVGPLTDRAKLSEARTKVVALGFKDAFLFSPKKKP